MHDFAYLGRDFIGLTMLAEYFVSKSKYNILKDLVKLTIIVIKITLKNNSTIC